MKRSERGFTLIELLVVVAIVALIGGAASMATSQVITGTKRSNDHMTAIRQVQNAGYWISRDTLMAQSVVAGDDPETAEIVEFITLNWTEWEKDEGKKGDKDSKYHLVTYYFEDMADGLKRLERQHLIDGVEETTTFVAEHIYYNATTVVYETPVLTLQIAASVGEASETREYRVQRRPNF